MNLPYRPLLDYLISSSKKEKAISFSSSSVLSITFISILYNKSLQIAENPWLGRKKVIRQQFRVKKKINSDVDLFYQSGVDRATPEINSDYLALAFAFFSSFSSTMW